MILLRHYFFKFQSNVSILSSMNFSKLATEFCFQFKMSAICQEFYFIFFYFHCLLYENSYWAMLQVTLVANTIAPCCFILRSQSIWICCNTLDLYSCSDHLSQYYDNHKIVFTWKCKYSIAANTYPVRYDMFHRTLCNFMPC